MTWNVFSRGQRPARPLSHPDEIENIKQIREAAKLAGDGIPVPRACSYRIDAAGSIVAVEQTTTQRAWQLHARRAQHHELDMRAVVDALQAYNARSAVSLPAVPPKDVAEEALLRKDAALQATIDSGLAAAVRLRAAGLEHTAEIQALMAAGNAQRVRLADTIRTKHLLGDLFDAAPPRPIVLPEAVLDFGHKDILAAAVVLESAARTRMPSRVAFGATVVSVIMLGLLGGCGDDKDTVTAEPAAQPQQAAAPDPALPQQIVDRGPCCAPPLSTRPWVVAVDFSGSAVFSSDVNAVAANVIVDRLMKMPMGRKLVVRGFSGAVWATCSPMEITLEPQASTEQTRLERERKIQDVLATWPTYMACLHGSDTGLPDGAGTAVIGEIVESLRVADDLTVVTDGCDTQASPMAFCDNAKLTDPAFPAEVIQTIHPALRPPLAGKNVDLVGLGRGVDGLSYEGISGLRALYKEFGAATQLQVTFDGGSA